MRDLMYAFRENIDALPNCKVVNVIAVNPMLMIYIIEAAPSMEEKIQDYAFMTWIKNPLFQKYYKDYEAYKKIAEAYLIETTNICLN